MNEADPGGGATPGERPWPRVSRFRLAAPVVVIVAALVAAGVVATTRERGSAPASSGSTPSGAAPGGSGASVPITYASAAKEGTTGHYSWGAGCDPKTGRYRMPIYDAPPCVPVPPEGAGNGGATAAGVTSTAVNVVYYEAQAGGLASAVASAAGTPAQGLATAQDFTAMFNRIFELYGRHVNLIPFTASGAATDPVAAHADAITVAQQLHAFASIGGPAQTPAYQDELARQHVFCMGCGDSSTYGELQQNAPYQWANLPTADTSLFETFDYVAAKLNGKPAIWAGDPAFHSRTRTFVVVSETSEPPSPGTTELSDELTKRIEADHLRVANPSDLKYTLDLATLPTQAATIAEKLKASGATSVVFAGDPIMPIYLTRACAAIGYSPEWIITGIVLTDTAVLGRYYDQSEWAHAFGVTSLGVPTGAAAEDGNRLYRWWYGAGTSPPSLAAPAIVPPILQTFTALQLAGPDLTPAHFTTGLFRMPPVGGGPTTPLLAYGEQGAAPRPSYSSPADYAFIWYDATAKGPDEEGVTGTGLMRFVNGGARYRAGVVPSGPVPMFSLPGSVTSYADPPDAAPAYAPWPGSPAASGAR